MTTKVKKKASFSFYKMIGLSAPVAKTTTSTTIQDIAKLLRRIVDVGVWPRYWCHHWVSTSQEKESIRLNQVSSDTIDCPTIESDGTILSRLERIVRITWILTLISDRFHRTRGRSR